ncbi:SHOCT domain-containing protein [Streptomyces chiangmaiensis]
MVRRLPRNARLLGPYHHGPRPTLPRPQPTRARRLTRRPWTPPTPPSAEQLLAERFARGEIDEEEYQRRLRVLHSTGADLTKH